MNLLKKKNAITLIALIITIIVLLILAGVTINMVLGENGLFNKAKTSVAKYENAQKKENDMLAGYEVEINNISRDYYDNEIKALLNIDNLNITIEDIFSSETFMRKALLSKKTSDYMFSNTNCINHILQSNIALKEICKSETERNRILTNEEIYEKILGDNELLNELDKNAKKIPTLTGNSSSNEGTAIASSILETALDAWRGFDNGDTAGRQWATSHISNQYLGFNYTNAISLYKIELISVKNANDAQNPKSWYIQYSDDGTNWTQASDVITRESHTNPSVSTAFVRYGTGAHKYWSVLCVNSTGTKYIGIGELKFYGIN